MVGTWIASVILFIFCLAFQIPNFANDSQITHNRQVQIADDLIKIRFEDFESDDDFMISFGDTYINKYALYGDNIRASIYKTDSAHITIEKEISSQGRTRSIARNYASKINIEEKIEGNTIYIPEYYRIDKGDKYRGQDVRYKIYIPKNKKVEVDKNMRWTIRKNEFNEEE